MENDVLYVTLKNKICEMIYQGIYKDGENIPPERTLAETLHVSRVTVRKALHLLEKDGIIERVQGSGTEVRLPETGYRGTMDIIALVAPAQNPFFAAFIDYFQKAADQNDSLVLFMQNPQDAKVEDSLFKLYQKNIRNVVVWLEDLKVDTERIRRLRGLGMNIVFFDISVCSPYADCVLLDNTDAISTLYNYVKENGASKVTYIGWDNLQLSSVKERENTFKELDMGQDSVFHVPWKERERLSEVLKGLIKDLDERNLPDAVICADGEIGITLKKIVLETAYQIFEVVSVDDFKEAEALSLSVYRQSFQELAQKVYECLETQNKYSKIWKAAVYTIKGELIKR